VVACGWPAEELRHLHGHDPRMVRRLSIMLEDKAAQPLASIPEGSRGKAAVKAAYRMLASPGFSAADLCISHQQATWRRMRQHPVVLAVADTTSFNHTTHPDTGGIGPIGQGNGSAQGFWLHSVVAFSEAGEALGVLHAHSWAREKNPMSKRQRKAVKNSRPLEKRESRRWSKAYEAVAAQHEEQQKTAGNEAVLPRVVMVADRESDIYEVFVSNALHDSRCGLLVRALHPRRLQQDGQIVWDHLAALPELTRVELLVPAQGEREERTATLALRSAPVQLGVPRDKARLFKAREVLNLWAIEAVEINAPAGCEPLHWKLLSSMPAPDVQSVQRQLRWYTRRWGIEVFHRTLKSGLKCEARRLRSLEKLQRALSLDIIVAWRLMALRDAARQQPEAAAAGWLDQDECLVLVAWATRTAPQGQPTPGIGQAVLWIARLGGYLARKNDPPPGLQVLWRGLHHLHAMSLTWKLARLVGNS